MSWELKILLYNLWSHGQSDNLLLEETTIRTRSKVENYRVISVNRDIIFDSTMKISVSDQVDILTNYYYVRTI